MLLLLLLFWSIYIGLFFTLSMFDIISHVKSFSYFFYFIVVVVDLINVGFTEVVPTFFLFYSLRCKLYNHMRLWYTKWLSVFNPTPDPWTHTTYNTAQHTVLWYVRLGTEPQSPEHIQKHCPTCSSLRCQTWPWHKKPLKASSTTTLHEMPNMARKDRAVGETLGGRQNLEITDDGFIRPSVRTADV